MAVSSPATASTIVYYYCRERFALTLREISAAKVLILTRLPEFTVAVPLILVLVGDLLAVRRHRSPPRRRLKFYFQTLKGNFPPRDQQRRLYNQDEDNDDDQRRP